MTTTDRRRAARVEVGIPAQLYTRRGFVAATVRDLSRAGLRMRATSEDLGFESTEDLRAAARGIAAAFSPTFGLELDYERYGPLIQRDVSLARIGLPADAPTCVEICCAFERALSDEEEALLDASLPAVNETVDAWTEPDADDAACLGVVTMRPMEEAVQPVVVSMAHQRPNAFERPRQRYRTLVAGTKRSAPPAFFCHSDLITAVGVRVRLPRQHGGAGPSGALRRLIREHGKVLDVRVLGESEDLWRGRARLSGVELPTQAPDRMFVTLAYETPLSMSDLRRLGLLSRVA